MKASLYARVSGRAVLMLKALAQAERIADPVERRAVEDMAKKYCGAISRIMLEPHKGIRVAGKKKARHLPAVNQTAAELSDTQGKDQK